MKPTSLEIARKFAEELVGNYDTARLILTLADQVEALTSERDAYQQVADTMAAAHKVERDALAAAAKLALEALVAESRTTESNVTLVRILTAITSLRQAGVQ